MAKPELDTHRFFAITAMAYFNVCLINYSGFITRLWLSKMIWSVLHLIGC